MPECSSTWADTANCTGANANYIDVTMEADGDFYITWSVFQYTPFADVRNHVWACGFYADGSPKYDPVRVNDSGQALIQWDYHPDSVNLPRVVAELIPYNDIGTFVPGDINYNRSSDISDLIVLIDYMFRGGINSFWPRSIIDFNGSGENNIADLVYLVNYMFVGGPAPITPDEGIRPNPGKFDLGAN